MPPDRHQPAAAAAAAAGAEPRVPWVADLMCSMLERTPGAAGLFRTAADPAAVRRMRAALDAGDPAALDLAGPHELASLLKWWLRDLPFPLLPLPAAAAAAAAGRLHQDRGGRSSLRGVIDQALLPTGPANRCVLRRLQALLSRAGRHSKVGRRGGWGGAERERGSRT